MDKTYTFDLPPQNPSIIKVIGVGGGGSNAVNHMFNQGIRDVEFIVCNTDVQALQTSPVPNKLQIGVSLTQGLGAGANPEKGKAAALESKEDIRELLSDNTKMLFITAGMGGGTGTGAAPEIARVARELGILTVGIVTAPFNFEGRKKLRLANEGIEQMRKSCDTVLVILNDKLREVYSNLALSNAFAQADNVLTTAAKSIAEIITLPGQINVDFEDVKTVMANSGAAVMGSARADGDQRAKRAAEMALSSPLLDNINITGAQRILLSIKSGSEKEIQMDELTVITSYIQDQASEDMEMIFGHGVDEELGESVMVTVIATGFDHSEDEAPTEDEKRVIDLETNKKVKDNGNTNEPPPPNPARFEPPKYPQDDFTPDIQASDEEEPMEEEELSHEMSSQKRLLMEEAYKRKMRLRGRKSISAPDNDQDYFKKEDFNEPAYMRRNVHLYSVPSYQDRNVSRYSLDDDDNIISNNRFLHDNVD
uniref:Cell division protein FtsZ n=1 Tax=Roseihalotalea indica TaxID=2867963 RepID=A0AA49JF22_9BACT|nr:cell division protein FtsZ [Tunicatimonas sp. TK19036]